MRSVDVTQSMMHFARQPSSLKSSVKVSHRLCYISVLGALISL